jgi:hypothetical protein
MEHKDITDPNIHEIKGASTALAGQIPVAQGDGTTAFEDPTVYSNVEVGSYRIVNSSSTAIALTTAGTFYNLTNDGAGAGTASFGVTGVADVWDGATNQFTFDDFELGDVVLVSASVTFTTTSANTALDLVLELGVGDPGIYSIPLITQQNIKTASTTTLVAQRWVSLRDVTTKDFPARLKAKADTTGSTILLTEITVGAFKRG